MVLPLLSLVRVRNRRREGGVGREEKWKHKKRQEEQREATTDSEVTDKVDWREGGEQRERMGGKRGRRSESNC